MSHMQPESPDLLALQQAFCASTYAQAGVATDDMLCAFVADGGVPAPVRLEIYRNNTISNLRNALRADYPVVQKLVGDEFFGYAANTFIAATPSASGDINDYGDGFPTFLAAFPAAAGLPYLGDVARLEQAWKQCFFSAEAKADIDLSTFFRLPPESLGAARLRLHPALRLLSSPYPVLSIWRANQDEGGADPTEISLQAGAERVLLYRSSGQISMEWLAADEYAWLQALLENRTFADAVDIALTVDESFNLAPCLQRQIGLGNLIGYSTEETK